MTQLKLVQMAKMAVRQASDRINNYIVEFLHNGVEKHVELVPMTPDGQILEESSDGCGIYRGQLVSGGFIQIPVEAVTNVFAIWWLFTENNGRGHDSYHTSDDEVIERRLLKDLDNPDKWDSETGEHKTIRGSDDKPKHGRNIDKPDW